MLSIMTYCITTYIKVRVGGGGIPLRVGYTGRVYSRFREERLSVDFFSRFFNSRVRRTFPRDVARFDEAVSEFRRKRPLLFRKFRVTHRESGVTFPRFGHNRSGNFVKFVAVLLHREVHFLHTLFRRRLDLRVSMIFQSVPLYGKSSTMPSECRTTYKKFRDSANVAKFPDTQNSRNSGHAKIRDTRNFGHAKIRDRSITKDHEI